MLVVDVAKLLLNFFQIKIKELETSWDFVDRFNRSVGKIPLTNQATEKNQLCVFIFAMQIEIKFLLLCLKVQTLQDAQREVIRLEDDMILSGMKCK